LVFSYSVLIKWLLKFSKENFTAPIDSSGFHREPFADLLLH
jgi:hypothetical protein